MEIRLRDNVYDFVNEKGAVNPVTFHPIAGGLYVAQVGGILGFGAWMNGYGRTLEDQADRVGLRYAYEGGFDVAAAPGVWQRFLKKYGDGDKVTNFFFSDHSTAAARRKHLEEEIRLNYARR